VNNKVTISINTEVNRGFQFVAVVLALLFLAGSLSVFGACLREDPVAMPKHCGSRCPMMMKTTPATSMELQAAPQTTSCCDISSGKPAPVSVLQAPSNRSLAAPVAATVGLFAYALSSPRTESRDGVPSGRSSPSQAVLCILLI
jgi:hypothetical protein